MHQICLAAVKIHIAQKAIPSVISSIVVTANLGSVRATDRTVILL